MTFPNMAHQLEVETVPQILTNVIRIGPNFQVEIPEYRENRVQDNANELYRPVWIPNPDKIDDISLDLYLNEAQQRYGCNELNALTILYRLDYNAQAAIAELGNN